MPNDDADEIPIEDTDPSAKDVLHQQDVDASMVEEGDRLALQKDLENQGVQRDDFETNISEPDATDDRNSSDGQLIGGQ